MADEFDPDNFDWEDHGLGEADVAIHDLIRDSALQALSGPDPIRYVRPNVHDKERPRPLFKNRYSLDEQQTAYMETDHAGWIIDHNSARLNHDHPLSHVSRELYEYEMVEPFAQESYIDMHGNPGRNAKYNRSAVTMGGMYTPKAHIRYYQKRGVLPVDIEGIVAGRYGTSKNISNTHALYYESLDTIARLCNAGFMYHALIHRHSEAHGFLNHGEQEYWVDMNGTVRQQNIHTGETYTHPTCEPFFHQETALTSFGGITWDRRKAGPDSYVLRFVAAPVEMCKKFCTLDKLASSDAKIVVADDVTIHSFLGYRWYTKGSGGLEVELTDQELLESLRRYIAGRKRTPEKKEDLMNFCRRNCNKNDVISVHRGYYHKVPAERMIDYVNAAFYMDIAAEIQSAIHFETKYAEQRKALNQFYEKGTLPTHIYTPAEAIGVVARTVTSVVGATIKHLPVLFAPPPTIPVVDWAAPASRKHPKQFRTAGNGKLVGDTWKQVWSNAQKV